MNSRDLGVHYQIYTYVETSASSSMRAVVSCHMTFRHMRFRGLSNRAPDASIGSWTIAISTPFVNEWHFRGYIGMAP
jgi:hypothetical protein